MRAFTTSSVSCLGLALVLTGCAQSVAMIKPAPGSNQINPVRFELKFHPRANQPTLKAVLNGPGVHQDISNVFSRVPNDPLGLEAAGPVPYLPPGRYTLRTEAKMSSQQAFDVTGKDWSFRVPNRAIQMTPAYEIHDRRVVSRPGEPAAPSPVGARSTPLPMDRVDVIVSNTRRVNLNLLEPSNNDVSVTLEPSHSNIAINGLAPGATVTLIIPAHQLSTVFTVMGVQLGTAQITAKARANGYHDGAIPVNIVAS